MTIAVEATNKKDNRSFNNWYYDSLLCVFVIFYNTCINISLLILSILKQMLCS